MNTSINTQLESKRIEQLESMRPTLVAGFGGTGQLVLLNLKQILDNLFGDAWHAKIKLLAFDTTKEPVSLMRNDTGESVSLEPNAEFFHIGNVPISSIVRNIDMHDTIRERLGDVIHTVPASVLLHGSKQTRPLGLASFLWQFSTVFNELSKAIWQLAGRDRPDADQVFTEQGVNAFVINSLGGGTGSGIFLDATAVIRDLFRELGTQGEFCHITGIGVLPQAFKGVRGKNIIPNTGAALRELNHVMVDGGFAANYPNGRIIDLPGALFDLYIVLDGVDEHGQTWSGIKPLAAMAASAISIQMASQLGRKGENDFDNVSENLIGVTRDGEGTFLSSVGIGTIEFQAPEVVDYCAKRLLADVIANQWLQPVQSSVVGAQVGDLLAPVADNQIAPALLHDPVSDGEMRIDLYQPDWLRNQTAAEVGEQAERYLQEYGHARVKELYLPQIRRNATQLAAEHDAFWKQWVSRHILRPEMSLPHVLATLKAVENTLSQWDEQAQRQLVELDARSERHTLELSQSLAALYEAADSFPLGRTGRIRAAMTRCFQAAENLYTAQFERQLWQAKRHLWGQVTIGIVDRRRDVERLQDQVATLKQQLDQDIPRHLRALVTGGVARISLADESYLGELYRQFAPQRVDLTTHLSLARVSGNRTPLADDMLTVTHLSLQVLRATLLAALRIYFERIESITVEDAVKARSAIMSPKARLEQLFHLATPSWNIDRSRLPEGGADLARIEVMGVNSAENSLFRGMLQSIVSTHDPYRLTALVVTAGAPASALQQYDIYERKLEQVRSTRALFVLPAFMADGKQARLAFALGSIFGQIQNKGTFFYYHSADSLTDPFKLANGLTNAIQAFAANEQLVREVTERNDAQVARLGLQEAIRILDEYVAHEPKRSDDTTRELRRLIRDYVAELRSINEFSGKALALNGKVMG